MCFLKLSFLPPPSPKKKNTHIYIYIYLFIHVFSSSCFFFYLLPKLQRAKVTPPPQRESWRILFTLNAAASLLCVPCNERRAVCCVFIECLSGCELSEVKGRQRQKSQAMRAKRGEKEELCEYVCGSFCKGLLVYSVLFLFSHAQCACFFFSSIYGFLKAFFVCHFKWSNASFFVSLRMGGEEEGFSSLLFFSLPLFSIPFLFLSPHTPFTTVCRMEDRSYMFATFDFTFSSFTRTFYSATYTVFSLFFRCRFYYASKNEA